MLDGLEYVHTSDQHGVADIGSYMDVSENRCTPKSSILIGFSIMNRPFWGASFLETPALLLITTPGVRTTTANH